MDTASSTFTVSGTHGFLVLLAVILFAVAAIIAWLVPGHKAVHVLIAAGLALWSFSQLWSG